MRRLAAAAFFAFVLQAFGGGFSLTVENDFFTGSDDNYTHGMELLWLEPGEGGESSVLARSWGAKSRMYTPKDIKVPGPQPGDRPWCGLTTAFEDWWRQEGDEAVRYGVELGVLGPSSGCEEMQKWFHGLIGNDEPEGWANQFADEPVLDAYMERWRKVASAGKPGGFGCELDVPYGGVVGTAFANVSAGASFVAGWNARLPYVDASITPKDAGSEAFLCAVVDVRGYFVAHNATLGWSLWRGDRDGRVDLENWVGEARAGLAAGYGWLSATYMVSVRSAEFDGGEPMDWGLARLALGRVF